MKQIIRKCIVTHERLPKSQMIRVVRCNGIISIDTAQNIKGRGAYIKNDLLIIKKVKSKNILSRVFKTNVDKKIYDELLEVENAKE